MLILCIFFDAYANYLSLNNDGIVCYERVCDFSVKSTVKFRVSKDNRILELFEENMYGKDKLISYLFYTTDIVNVVAYSGKPLEILISLTSDGFISDLKLVKHSEPILLTGIPIEKLLEAVSFYKDKNINSKIAIGEDIGGSVSVPIIAGATVTSLILHETVLESAREVYSMFYGSISSDSNGGLTKDFKRYSWNDLLHLNAIKRYALDSFLQPVLTNTDIDNLLVDIFFADLTHPSIGKNLLGEKGYDDLFDDLHGNSAILILNKGTWSFKGSGFVRGGIFDRFRIEQDGNMITFRDNDFKNLYDLELIDVEDFREVGIFVVSSLKYKPHKPWNLILLLNYKTFSIEYKMPKTFCISENVIMNQWTSKIFNISLLCFLWVFVIFIFIIRDYLSKNKFYLSMIYNFVLLLDVYIIGFLLHGQPSIVNLFALKNIDVFLFDPYLCIGWIMIFSTIFIWGKAIFCGWICPFGALQEIIFKIKSFVVGEFSLELSIKKIVIFRNVRYFILFFLFSVSIFYSVIVAERLAEIEPFKTIWGVGIFNREWYISFYTLFLLFFSALTYRFFCRFICPLGAFLSILSGLSILKLKRRGTCAVCSICRNKCNSKAIDFLGRIDSKECFGCFTCVNNMYNKSVCPPLFKENIWYKYEKGKWLG